MSLWPFRSLRRSLTVAHSNRVQPTNNVLFNNKKVATLTSSASSSSTPGEARLAQLLKDKLAPNYLKVKDISGGCGAMYQITIGSEVFKGKRTIEQHKMVNQALGDEIKSLHGLTIQIHNPDDHQ